MVPGWKDLRFSRQNVTHLSFINTYLKPVKHSHFNGTKIQPVHPKRNQSWIFIGRTDAEAKTPILWPPDVKNWPIGKDSHWERFKAGEEDDKGWDGGMASPTLCTWVWLSSGSWWWTGKPGELQSMGLQRAGHDWVTELTENSNNCINLNLPALNLYTSCGFYSGGHSSEQWNKVSH